MSSSGKSASPLPGESAPRFHLPTAGHLITSAYGRAKRSTLQRKLYRKGKAEPAFHFYVLYDKICREDILRHAYGLARANAGAPGPLCL